MYETCIIIVYVANYKYLKTDLNGKRITAHVNLAILLYWSRGHAAGATGAYTSSALYTNIRSYCMPVSTYMG